MLSAQGPVALAGGAAGRGNGVFQLTYPGGVAVDSQDNLYVADVYNHRIQKITPDGVVTTFAGIGTAGLGENQFTFPRTVAIDKMGNVYVADSYNHRVRRISPDGTNVNVAGDGTLGTDLNHLNFPRGVAVDSDGNLFIADNYNHRIIRRTVEGIVSVYWGGKGQGSGPLELTSPAGLAVDRDGTLYIADSANHRVQKVTRAGVATTVAGVTGIPGPDPNQLAGPVGVDVDAAGNIYVSDTGSHRVQMVTPSGTVRTVAGGVGGPGERELNQPFDTALDSAGNLYIADAYNHRVERWTMPPASPQIWNSATNRTGPGSPNAIMRLAPLPACKDQLKVLVGGFTAVASPSVTGLDFVVPEEVDPSAPTEVYILCGQETLYSALSLPMVPVQPRLYANWMSLASAENAVSFNLIDTANPAKAGDAVSVYGTGFGLLSPANATGNRLVLANVTATIGDSSAEVLFAGVAPGQSPGLQQINILIPPGLPPGLHEFRIAANGAQSQGSILIPIE